MASHYIKLILKASFQQVYRTLRKTFGNIHNRKFARNENLSTGIILGEKYYTRATGNVAIVIILNEQSPEETEIEVISCAGGKSWFMTSLGAQKSYARKVKKYLKAVFEIASEEEISYFGY